MGEVIDRLPRHVDRTADAADYWLRQTHENPKDQRAHREAAWHVHALVKLIVCGATPAMTPEVKQAVERFQNG